ncbi:hypothetical protein CNR22_16955 [Sphingobacteriaceae bacterium]|nr:hypothetical protein CNR22_16955 [Sphingobacteriaceae bacterium]
MLGTKPTYGVKVPNQVGEGSNPPLTATRFLNLKKTRIYCGFFCFRILLILLKNCDGFLWIRRKRSGLKFTSFVPTLWFLQQYSVFTQYIAATPVFKPDPETNTGEYRFRLKAQIENYL